MNAARKSSLSATSAAQPNRPAKQVEIKVLSIQQPAAEFVVLGSKWCENRTWQTKHRGPLFIHASKWDVAERRELEDEGVDITQDLPSGGRTGAIIGYVDLYGCFPLEDVDLVRKGKSIPQRLKGLAAILDGCDEDSWDFGIGPRCWILTDPKYLKTPIPAKGNLNVCSKPKRCG